MRKEWANRQKCKNDIKHHKATAVKFGEYKSVNMHLKQRIMIIHIMLKEISNLKKYECTSELVGFKQEKYGHGKQIK